MTTPSLSPTAGNVPLSSNFPRIQGTSQNNAGQSGIPSGKKTRSKKATDPDETSKLVAAKISQLEHGRAEERDQEAEIDREVKRATKDLSNLLSKIESPLSRIDVVQRKYTDLLSDMRRLERENIKNKKKSEQLQKEKDHSRVELSKTIGVKEKLEKLCRELQRENKKAKDEQRRLDEDERIHRDELNSKFNEVLGDFKRMAVGDSTSPQGRLTNLEMDDMFKQKFRSFIDQYELREIHFHSLLRTKELEVQYHMAKSELLRKHVEHESRRSQALTNQVSTFSQTEAELRSQLNIYVEKFKQVEDTLNNSNDLFFTFRKEMEEMSKKTKRLEKENVDLHRKKEVTSRNLIETCEQREKLQEALRKQEGNYTKLANTIRRMAQQGRPLEAGVEIDERGVHLPGDEEEATDSDYEDEELDDDRSDEGEDVSDNDTDQDILSSSKTPETRPQPHDPKTRSRGSAINSAHLRKVNGHTPVVTNGHAHGHVNPVNGVSTVW